MRYRTVKLSIIVLLLAGLSGCNDCRRSFGDCVGGAICNTSNPCTTGNTVCGADGTAHCVVVEVLENCSAQPQPPGRQCVEGAPCATGNPCTTGRVACDVDDNSICLAVERLPDCDY